MHTKYEVIAISKYNNKKVVADDITFDSELECKYYIHLKGLCEKGIVKDFELQKKFELQPGFKKNGKSIRPIEYITDFVVTYADGRKEIVDTKGMITPDFAIKKKLFEYKFPDMELKLVTFSKIDGGWIELSQLKKDRTKRRKERELKKSGKV